MLEFINELTWLIIIVFGGLGIVYCLARLSAIAWYKTKKDYEDDYDYLDHSDYDEEHPEPKRQNDEEL